METKGGRAVEFQRFLGKRGMEVVEGMAYAFLNVFDAMWPIYVEFVPIFFELPYLVLFQYHVE